MLNIHTKIFAQNGTPNTFIGGVAKLGGTGINTPIDNKYLIASKLQINPSRITNFKVIGDDIQFRVKGVYTLPSSTFLESTTITRFIDIDNLASTTYGLHSGRAFERCINITEIRMNGAVYVHESFANRCPNLEILQLDSLQGVGNQPFWGNPKLLTFKALNLTSLTGNNSAFRDNTLMTEAKTPLINKLYGQHYSNCVKLIQAIHDKAVSVGQLAFSNCTSIELISLKKAKTLIATSTPQYVFNNIKMGCVIRVNDFLRTSNGGLADDNLTYAKDDRGATVEFYDDAGNYVSTL